jgi:CubicO group peptidase (beta-lactamase class C family)
VCAARSPRALCHPGQGGSIGWADPDEELAVAICHNRLFNPATREDDAILGIADAVRIALGLQ